MHRVVKPLAALSLALFFLWVPPVAAEAQLDDLYEPSRSEWGSITSWDHRYPGVPSWVPDNEWQQTFNRKYVELGPGERYTIAEIDGPGVINRIFFTFPVKVPRHNARAMVLRIYWDDEENPSVLSPLGDFFGLPFGKYVQYDSMPFSVANGGMVCRFHMPFRRKARIEIENGWDKKADLIFFGVNWYKTPELPEDVLYFHALWKRTNPTIEGRPHLVADLAGKGKFVGLQLFLQNLSDFWYKDFNSLMQPEGFGMGNLEGWEEIVIDGETVQHGTGTEEYINAGAYFASGRRSGIYEGVHVRSYLTGRTGVYRFHLQDPIPFNQSYRMIWRHGPLDSIRSDYASIAYWYQNEPHAPHRIDDLAGRFPTPAARHAAQAVWLAPLVFGNKLANAAMFE